MNEIIRKVAEKISSATRRTDGALVFLVLSGLLFIFSNIINLPTEDTAGVAAQFSRKIENRLRILDNYAEEAIRSDHSTWMKIKLPEDMVIYRYVYDSLQSWCNQFPVNNDDISSRIIFTRLSSFRDAISSPLSYLDQETNYVSLGPKWYIIRTKYDGVACKVVYGLEIQNKLLTNLQISESGVNPELELPRHFTVAPLGNSGGDAVIVSGKPLFKIIRETPKNASLPTNILLKWLSLAAFLVSCILFFRKHMSIRLFCAVIGILAVCCTVTINWGMQLRYSLPIFSPSIYADGPFFFSFGTLIIINTFVFLYLLCVYMCRKKFIARVLRKGKRRGKIIYTAGIILTIAATVIYIHFTLRSLIMNSNINLELHQWYNLSVYSAIVYLSYCSLFFCILLLIQMLRPPVFDVARIRYNAFSGSSLLVFATITAVYMTTVTGALGFRKEQNRLTMISNRLAVDRDLTLEIQLRSVEDAIAEDPIIASLSEFDKNNVIILNRISESYLYRVSQNYSITVTLCRDRAVQKADSDNTGCLDYFSRKLRDGDPISGSQRFRFIHNEFGSTGYLGAFVYYSDRTGVVHMFLEIKDKNNIDDNGYMNILERSSRPDQVNLPPYYSMARFKYGKLITFKGNYPYPTVFDESILRHVENGADFFREKKYIHFINRISDDEIIFISRPVRGAMTYFISFSYMIIAIFGSLYVISGKYRNRKNVFANNYYRTRINFVMVMALFLTLVIMTIVSITFVYKRNETNMYNTMSAKINTIQALMEPHIRHASDWDDLNSADIAASIDNISNTTKSDITLYTPGGKIFRSTSPEIFEKLILGSRMNQDAFYNIRFKNQRFYINREEIADKKYYSLYAPLFNENGTLIAILNSPYTDQSYVFRRDAFFHGATIANLFIILLFATILLSTTVVNKMFRPLVEMGKKMNSTDIHSLERITYDRKDEISTLVDAYNRMVVDLSESTKKLAQAERDKAWSEMARQVAHEIKNPLTPIKLEIQRLIRLKQKNDDSWSEKFDRVSAVILEHIDILTDTANEFSTFAKLYSEEPVSLDLDTTLRDQLLIFDNRENINIDYFGLTNSYVLAPKPQLIRVFVNLLTNAIQAIAIMQAEQQEKGEPVTPGRILVCVRNSINFENSYDIVFEDNGPGVSEENLPKLFHPNFTTKSAGTGLGLAICRNIVEKCNGTIEYHKSDVLKGACFTVRLPKDRVRMASRVNQ